MQIMEELEVCKHEIESRKEEVNKFNLIKEFCDWNGETEYERSKYFDIYNGYSGSFRDLNNKIISYSTIRTNVNTFLYDLEECER